MGFTNNLREWRESKRPPLSREALAEMLGVTAVSVYRIEKGQQQPRPALLEKICTTLRKDKGDFYRDKPNVEPASPGTRRIPILDFVQAGEFTMIAPSPDESVLTTLQPSADSFALRIRGRSMEPEFREGDLVIIDPAVYPRAEDYVVAVDEDGDGTFKKFHDVGLNENSQRVFELVSLNPAYPSWRSDRKKITIRGTLVEHRRFRNPPPQ